MALYHMTKGPVDYTVVGTPTIMDGVVSNFSSGALTSEQAFSPGSSTWEIGFDFTTGSFTRAQGVITGVGTTNSIAPLFIQNDGRMSFFASSVGGSSWDLANQFNIGNIAANTHYFIKEKYTGSEYTIDVWINGVQQTQTVLSTSTPIIGGLKLLFGNNRNTDGADYFRGSINLNNTYIIIDGQPWFGLCPIEVKKHQLRGPAGYTVVGSPTITDGVASGFSGSNYLKTPVFSPGSNRWEIVQKFTTDIVGSSNQGIMTGLGTGTGTYNVAPFYIAQKTGYKLTSFLSSNGSSWNIANDFVIGELQENTTYKFKMEFTGSAYNWLVLENNSWTLLKTIETSSPIYGNIPLVIGNNRGNNYPFNGSIDLNETYIKVNGKLWFYQPAPTKYIVKDGKLVWADPNIYLQSTGTQYINTGIPSAFDTLAVDATFMKTQNLSGENGLFGGKGLDDNQAPTIYQARNQSGSLNCWCGTGTNAIITEDYTLNTKYNLRLSYDGASGRTWTLNGVNGSSTVSNNARNNPGNLAIFADGSSPMAFFAGRIYGFKLIKNGVLVRDLIPVPQGLVIGTYTVPSNGMFDIVNQQFYPNAGTGTFTIGRDA